MNVLLDFFMFESFFAINLLLKISNQIFQLNLTFISKFVFRSACTPIVANNPRYALFGQINAAKLFNDHHLHVAKALRLNKPEQLRRIVGMKPDAAC